MMEMLTIVTALTSLTEESIIDNAEFWKALLVDKGSNSLSEYIKNKYQLDDGPMVQQDGDEE